MVMKKIKIKANKKIAAVAISVLVFGLVSLLHLTGAFQFFESKSYDFRVRLFADSRSPSHDIVIILVRNESIEWAQRERGWGWPWPRKAYAEMLDFMRLGGAASVAFDIIFSEPSVFRSARQDEIIDNVMRNLEIAQAAVAEGQSRGPLFRETIRDLRELSARGDDASFAEASMEFGRAVQTVLFTRQSSVLTLPPDLNKPVFNLSGFENFPHRFDDQTYRGALLPIPEIRNAAGALGCITGTADSDGIFRRMHLFSLFDEKAVPGLSAASLLVSGYGNDISYDHENMIIRWGDFTIPVDRNGASLLRFRGDLSRYFPYNAEHILQSLETYNRGEEPLLHPAYFEGAHVFIGYWADGLYDTFSTPIASVYPGMGMHITMLDNILQGDFIRESRQWLNLLILFFVISFTVLLCLFSSRIILPVTGTVLAVIGITAAVFAAFVWGGLWLPMIVQFAGIVTAFITATLYNYTTEGHQKRFIKSAFSQYLSPKVIDRIIADPSQLKLGGEKREMTAIFTDVRAFSTIAEALGDPQKLVELLNHYLTRMSNIILDNQGTIDKYEGDAIIAFFGAPIHFTNHASLACRSAVKMKKAEIEVNREALAGGLVNEAVLDAMFKKGILKSPDDPRPLLTRLGINTGDMVVGNMGTPNKMDYTIMGNAVNLSARLEGVNKQYDTGILISEYTRAQIGDEFVLRPLNRVRVVGINTPLRLYELLDIKEEAPPELFQAMQNWERGLAAYEGKDFSAAADIFGEIFRLDESDTVAKNYLNRCKKFTASPPDDTSWDNGVDNLTAK